jgi:hypothetical protein
MLRMSGRWDPETGEKLATVLGRQVEAMFHDRHPDTSPDDPVERVAHLQGLALAELVVSSDRHGPGTARSRTDLVVLVDLDTLRSGKHPRSVAETAGGAPLPVGELRRLACEATIIPVVLGGAGEVLDMGRGRRLATPEQRRALRVMYPTCAVPGCTARFEHCQVHHLDPWAAGGGETNLGALVPLCTGHHRDIHLERITIELTTPSRAITVRDRVGDVLTASAGPPGRRSKPPPPSP